MNENQEKLALVVAETILANTKLLQSLVDTLPKAVADVVVKTVTKEVKATPVAAPVQAAAPAPVKVEPVVVEPVVVPPVATPIVQEMVTPVVATVTATPVTVSPSNGAAPFKDQAGLTKWVMSRYGELGPIKGTAIQGVLTGLGYKNINGIDPKDYDAIYAQIGAL